jgi:hypothetical protein
MRPPVSHGHIRSMHRFILLAVVAVPLLAGCYTYRPITNPGIRNGELVRVTLTDSGAVSLASQLGPATENVSGRVVRDSAGSFVLAVSGTRRRGGLETDWKGEHVTVPRPLVAHLEQRRFSRRRTALAAVGLVAIVVGTREAFWGPGGVFGGAPPGGSGGPR